MIVALLFWTLMILCCGFAAAFGGRSGRAIAFFYLLNIVATWAVTRDPQAWRAPHLAALLVDAALLVALIWVALRSDRWFPIWFAGFHMVAVASHFGSVITPGFAPRIYFFLQALWSVPMLLSLVIGISLDRRQGIIDESRSRDPAESSGQY
jgi:hypothetical protein